MTAPTGTEATTARVAEVLAERMGCGPGEIPTETVGVDVDGGPGEIAVGQLCRSNAHNYAYWGGTCQFADDLAAALLSAGVIRDMQAAALREAADEYTNNVGGTKARPHARQWLRGRAARIEEG